MKRLAFCTGLLALTLLSGSLAAQEMTPTRFTVRIENISGENTQVYSSIGVVGVPVDATQRGVITPGNSYEFTVKAAPGDRLSFASMYGQSNDTFFAPDENGIALYDEMGAPFSGDVSEQVWLWDAGTEVNEPLGEGPNQAPRQASPDAGEPENGVVTLVDDPMHFPPAAELMHVTLTPVDDGHITVRIDNVSQDAPVPTPFSPLVYVVHTAEQSAPFFTTGEADRGLGLERLAESGNPEGLAAAVAGSAVMNVGLSPGVFVIHSTEQSAPFFTTGEADRGQGLEAQAEDGSPVALSETLTMEGMYKQVGVFNTPVGAMEPGALMPGQAYEFSFSAAPGDVLSFVEMFGQSNDLVFATGENGIALFNGSGTPIGGTFSGAVQIWDVGTEVNQEPFAGADQAPRQAAPNTGESEMQPVTPISWVNDGFTYPSALASIKVTISNEMGMDANMMAMDDMMGDGMMAMTPETMIDDDMTEMATPEAMMEHDMMEMTPEATPAS